MRVRPLLVPFVIASLLAVASAQQQKQIAYPQRDVLSPFRSPGDVYAPPDALYNLLRRMRSIAEDPATKKDFDTEGREIADQESWQEAKKEVDRIGLDAGYLAQIMRLSKNTADRATAFYAAFYCKRPDYVINLISHIPGEPERKTREAAFPRAIAYLRAHLKRRFGELSDDEKKTLTSSLPEPGSPAAKAAGIVRKPQDADYLNPTAQWLIPFFQLLDLDDPLDQAQGLWFLKEVFLLRLDLALVWLEPALPRVRELIGSGNEKVREQAIGLLAAIGPADLPRPKVDAESTELQAFAERAARALFPPIRNLNDAIVQLHPSPERDAIVVEGKKALENSSIGDPMSGKTKDGMPFRGLRIAHVPDKLKALAIPKDAVITTVNGVAVQDAPSLLRVVKAQIETLKHPRVLLVEYVFEGGTHAVEYRLM